jgi:hypothetical protein
LPYKPSYMSLRLPTSKKSHHPIARIANRVQKWGDHLRWTAADWMSLNNQDLRSRFMGHYHLYQHFRRSHKDTKNYLPPVAAYILQYKSGHGIKYGFAKAMSFLVRWSSIGMYHPDVEIEAVNRLLVTEKSNILRDFLESAEDNLDLALRTAIQRVRSHEFFDIPGPTPEPASPILIQVNTALSNVNNSSFSYEEHNEYNQITFQPAIKEGPAGATGKEAGVFSKKQTLILFDLLSESAGLERIDLSKPNKFEAIAGLLHAITGKSAQSFIEEIKDHRTSGLYSFHTAGEKQQLIVTLTNLSQKLHAAGFKSLATTADKKIKDLERTKKDG